MMNMDLSRVMDAYRGQEDKLRKRVQLSNDLLELIAYEQLTREKRQLMAAKQAQAMPPGGLPTIRDQKEEEAFELTKQELAQQVGKTLQQQEAMRRQAMGRGVAAAPGAQNVMPQQAMAAGGIVAFKDGGMPPSTAAEMLTAQPEEREAPATKAEIDRMTFTELQRYNRTGEVPARLREVARAPETPQAADADLQAAFAPSGAMMPPRTQDAAPPPPRDTGAAAAPDLRTPSAVGTGIESALAGALPPNNDALMRQLQGEMRTSLLRSRASRDQPQMAELARLRGEIENLGTTFPKESPEARRQAEAEQARLEQQYARMMDPEKQRLDNLIAFLAGGAGRRGIGSVLGGAAESANRARAASEAFGLQALKDMQAGRQAMRGRDVEEQRAAFQARQRGLELGAKVAEVAAQIEAQTDIADRKIDSELAAAAMGALQRYGSDLNKIKAEVQTKAAQLGYEINRDDLNRIAQIAVAQIGAGARESGSIEQLLNQAIGERARIAERISDNSAKARENPLLSTALGKAADKRSNQEKRLVEEYENALQADREILQGLDRQIAELRARSGRTPTPPPAATGSARSQGVTVTGATAPPR